MTTTLAPSTIASIILPAAERTLAYGEALLVGIPPEKFAHMPHPTMNHAAFNYGHLSIYPDRLLAMLGRGELARPKEGWEALFAAGATCVEQEGRYPSKDEIAAHYRDRYGAVIEVVREVPEEIFGRPNPAEGRFRELFPTIGSAVNFLLNNHPMMHLGQVSAWRRALGLPSAM